MSPTVVFYVTRLPKSLKNVQTFSYFANLDALIGTIRSAQIEFMFFLRAFKKYLLISWWNTEHQSLHITKHSAGEGVESPLRWWDIWVLQKGPAQVLAHKSKSHITALISCVQTLER